jgi:hypothetical protein
MSAFSLFFTWSESFLAYQRRLESGRNGANCKSLFGIEMFPSDDPFLLCWKWCRPNSSSRALIRHLEQRCQPGAWRTLIGRATGYRRHHAHIFTGSDVRIQEGRQIRYSRFERGLSQATPGVLFDLSGVDLSRIENVREVSVFTLVPQKSPKILPQTVPARSKKACTSSKDRQPGHCAKDVLHLFSSPFAHVAEVTQLARHMLSQNGNRARRFQPVDKCALRPSGAMLHSIPGTSGISLGSWL